MKKLILGFAGEMVSGKGTSAKYYIEKHGAVTYRFSTILRDILRRIHIPEERVTMQRLSAYVRTEFGEDVLAKVLFEDAKNDTSELVIVDGIRRLEDVKYLRELPEFKLCYITAPMKIRYDRLVIRGENADDATKSFEDFQDEHEAEAEREIVKLEAFADEVIDNAGSIEELHGTLDQILTKYHMKA
jgi:dephospho-CoA kinase